MSAAMPPSRWGLDRGLSKDQSPGCRILTRGGTCKKPGFAYSADRLREPMKHCALGSQFITTAKASCQAFTAAALIFFRRQDARQLFPADADAESGKFWRTSVQSDLLRSAPHQSSE